MADLRAGAVGAVKEIAFHHDAAAHAGAKGDKDHVVAALTAALPEFTQGGHVGVVARLHREACEGGQGVGDIEHTPAQVDAFVDNTLGIDGYDKSQESDFCR